MFQSSPALMDGRNMSVSCRLQRSLRVFQSSPALMDGRNSPRRRLRTVGVGVSILARPDGRAQHCQLEDLPPRCGVSILARPDGRAQPTRDEETR